MGDNKSDGKMTRRSALDSLLGGCLAVGAVGFAGGALSFWYPPDSSSEKKDKVKVGKKDSIPLGDAIKADFNGKPVIVVHLANGFFAVSAKCTHLGCIADWNKDKQLVICPCHNAQFDYKGNIVGGPPPKPLESFAVDVQGDDVYVGKGGA